MEDISIINSQMDESSNQQRAILLEPIVNSTNHWKTLD